MTDLLPFVVLKFGGTSVSSAARWVTLADAAAARLAEGLRPWIVCSAVAGVSDRLAALLPAAVAHESAPILAWLTERHEALAADLGVSLAAECLALLSELERAAAGATLTGEFSARLQARVMASGELLSTRLGATWLAARGLPVQWRDARTLLVSRSRDEGSAGRALDPARWLEADFSDDFDPALADEAPVGAVVLTQGFIGRDPNGDTVLLGRGGSDTSASLFAARLGAQRCEIWTDVPGVFTAHPRDIPSARLLRHLDYAEAQELATAGAKVLHPRCLPPVARHGIPLHIRSTERPDLPGTVVDEQGSGAAAIKAIAVRRDVTLVSMDTLGMWQQVGFLAEAFACFARQGLSVDLVSTAQTNVTASLEPSAGGIAPERLDALLADLGRICRARVIGPCAAVSLVGRQIRGILPELAPALEVFESTRVLLMTQAANDLNLTFVVDAGHADPLVRRLHGQIFGARGDADGTLGPTWAEITAVGTVEVAPPESEMPWWVAQREALLAEAAAGTPVYVYDESTVRAAARRLRGLASVDRVLYAVKANDHPAILGWLADEGLGFECVSEGEWTHVLDTLPGFSPERILYTPNFAARGEMERAIAAGLTVTVDALHPLREWPELFGGRALFLRLDPGKGRGHHPHVRTAGPQSKFGIALDDLPEAAALVAAVGARVVGLHAHAGSGIRSGDAWRETAIFLAHARARFPDVRVLDLGGGLGVPYKPGQEPLDLESLDATLAEVRAAHPDLSLWLEPGRYLVAEAGVLLARVTQTKQKRGVSYVGVDAGLNSLLRPALYGAWHAIHALSRYGEPATGRVHVVGPICETGDTLGFDRSLPTAKEGDVLLIDTAGAYGRVMGSSYNRRPPAREAVSSSSGHPGG